MPDHEHRPRDPDAHPPAGRHDPHAPADPHGHDPHAHDPHMSDPHGHDPHPRDPHAHHPHGHDPHHAFDPHGHDPHAHDPHGQAVVLDPHSPHFDPLKLTDQQKARLHHGHFMTDFEAPAAVAEPRGNRWLALAVLSLSLLIIMIDHSVVNVALPNIVRQLGASTSELQWIIDAYILVFAGLLLTSGTIGDRYGRKGTLLVGYVVFMGGSVMAGLSDSVGGVIAARAIMGVGAALIMPSTLSLLPSLFPDKRERARAIGVWAGVAGVGSTIGPLVGGFLVDRYDWPAIFWVNVPLLAIALVGTLALVPASKSAVPQRLDLVGTALSIVGLVLVLWAIIGAPDRGWANATTLGTMAAGALFLVAFARWELHTPSPMLDLHVFRGPVLPTAVIAIGVGFLALGAAVFYIVQYLQFIFGYSALKAGLGIIPFAIAVGIGAPSSTPLSRRLGVRPVIVGGLATVAVGLLVMAIWTSADSYLPTGIGLVLTGVGIGLGTAPATRVMIAALPPAKAGIASAINDLTHEVASAVGIAVLGTVLATAYRDQITDAIGGLGLSEDQISTVGSHVGEAEHVAAQLPPDIGHELVGAANDAFLHAMHIGLGVSAALALLAALAALRMPRRVNIDDVEPHAGHHAAYSAGQDVTQH